MVYNSNGINDWLRDLFEGFEATYSYNHLKGSLSSLWINFQALEKSDKIQFLGEISKLMNLRIVSDLGFWMKPLRR